MKNSIVYKLGISLFFFVSVRNSYAGINWSQYDEGPEPYFGWETSLYFALGAIGLYGLLWLLTNNFKSNDGCFTSIITIAMIICALLSYYFIIPLGLLFYFLSKNRDNNK